MKNIKKIFVSIIIVSIFFNINTSSVFAIVAPKATFPTVNPIEPRPANLRPNISPNQNDEQIDDSFYLNREGNYQEPITDVVETENNTETPETQAPEKDTGSSPTFLIIIIAIISFILFYLYRKVIHKNSF